MNDNQKDHDPYRYFLLLNEIESETVVSQRELAGRLGIALGLVNSYLKNLVAKGYVRVKSFPRNRYSYLLTPQGFAEKSRLAYQHLSYFTSLYRVARQDYSDLFCRLRAGGVTEVILCGVDEVAEIAYLSMRESGVELAAVLDDDRQGEDFFGVAIKPLSAVAGACDIPVVISSLKKSKAILAELRGRDVDPARIFSFEPSHDPQQPQPVQAAT